jgi:hypothetical protein
VIFSEGEEHTDSASQIEKRRETLVKSSSQVCNLALVIHTTSMC